MTIVRLLISGFDSKGNIIEARQVSEKPFETSHYEIIVDNGSSFINNSNLYICNKYTWKRKFNYLVNR